MPETTDGGTIVIHRFERLTDVSVWRNQQQQPFPEIIHQLILHGHNQSGDRVSTVIIRFLDAVHNTGNPSTSDHLLFVNLNKEDYPFILALINDSLAAPAGKEKQLLVRYVQRGQDNAYAVTFLLS